jgi:ATP-dependent DNA ligase
MFPRVSRLATFVSGCRQNSDGSAIRGGLAGNRSTMDVTRTAPMLARLARELPRGDWVYEPKWDGFRCLAVRDGDGVELWSRNDRPLARYFPEVVEALQALPEPRFVLDGELLVATAGGFDFESLLARVHPAASRVERLRRETPALFVAFDVVIDAPFRARRARLEALLAGAPPPLFVTPATDDLAQAEAWLARFHGRGIDGVVAKEAEGRYEPGKRAMVKVKHERTADCVVAGLRLLAARPLPSSLLLGLWDDAGALAHVGVASGFAEPFRRQLVETLVPLVAPLEGHPWEHGFLLGGGSTGRLPGAAGRWAPGMTQDWTPLRPELVAEVVYDQLDGRRFRHPARFLRWRPDRDAASCALDQLDEPDAPDPLELLR